jgi:hypothetical protein
MSPLFENICCVQNSDNTSNRQQTICAYVEDWNNPIVDVLNQRLDFDQAVPTNHDMGFVETVLGIEFSVYAAGNADADADATSDVDNTGREFNAD